MMTIAVVNNNVVTSIVAVDESAYAQYATNAQAAIQIDAMVPQPQVGWLFDGANLNPPPSATVSVKITKLAFRNRFTFSELVAIQAASQTSMVIQVLQGNLAVATYIDLVRADTIAAINMLVGAGLLTSTRANTILTAPATIVELYLG